MRPIIADSLYLDRRGRRAPVLRQRAKFLYRQNVFFIEFQRGKRIRKQNFLVTEMNEHFERGERQTFRRVKNSRAGRIPASAEPKRAFAVKPRRRVFCFAYPVRGRHLSNF